MKKHTSEVGVGVDRDHPHMSLTWVSDEIREFENYTQVQINMAQIAPNSPFVPTSWAAWLAQRLEMNEERLRQLAVKIEKKKKAGSKLAVQPIFGGKVFPDFLTSVLSRQSIWRPGEVERPARPHAPWPDEDELQHEGSQRSKSGYSRFPPLPRVPGNATVNWKQRAPIVPFEFDVVGRPTLADDEVAPETDDQMRFLIGNSFLQELET